MFKERIKDFEIYLQKTNDEVFCAEVSVSLIKDDYYNPSEFIIVIKDISNRKKTENEILNYQNNLKFLNNALAKAEEKERKVIAEYLHDGIGQALSLARMNLTSLYQTDLLPEVKETIKNSAELINSAINETRSLTFDLSPPILHELGLVPALKWKLNQVKEKFGINTKFKTNNQTFNISNDLQVMIYRIVVELIFNIIKHANAEHINLIYKLNKNKLLISVIDDGIGFEYNANTLITKEGGFGLFSINERLHSVNGSMIINSTKANGTIVNIVIPLKN